MVWMTVMGLYVFVDLSVKGAREERTKPWLTVTILDL